MGTCCSSSTVSSDNQTDNLLSREHITLSKIQTLRLIRLQAWWRGNQTRQSVKLMKRDEIQTKTRMVITQGGPENFDNTNVAVSKNILTYLNYRNVEKPLKLLSIKILFLRAN
jgi:hypothetical protein